MLYRAAPPGTKYSGTCLLAFRILSRPQRHPGALRPGLAEEQAAGAPEMEAFGTEGMRTVSRRSEGMVKAALLLEGFLHGRTVFKLELGVQRYILLQRSIEILVRSADAGNLESFVFMGLA